MGFCYCGWDYCRRKIPRYDRRCHEHRNMDWWEEYVKHLEHCYAEDRLRTIHQLELAIDVVYESREQGGPAGARERLEREFGLDPQIFVRD